MIDATYPLDEQTREDITVRFTYHRPTASQPSRYQFLRDHAKAMALVICEQVPPGRERALALTKLEEMCMWANAGIARGERDQADQTPPATQS